MTAMTRPVPRRPVPAPVRVRALAAGLALVGLATMTGASDPGPSSAAALARTAWMPALLTPVPGSAVAYAVEATSDGCRAAPALRLVALRVGGTSRMVLSLPPVAPVSCEPTGDVTSLQFATSSDGVLVEKVGGRPVLYVTNDGATTWRRWGALAPTASDVLAAPRGISYLASTCSAMGLCRHYRLVAAPWAAPSWTSRPVALAALSTGVGHSVWASSVWIDQQTSRGLVIHYSRDAGATYTEWLARPLGAVTTCALTATSGAHLWAQCPTGMEVSFFVSGDAGRHWAAVSRFPFSGTGGGGFDPVSSTLAFLDYGHYWVGGPRDLFRVSGDGTAVAVGTVPCLSVERLDFVDARRGVALCYPQSNQVTGALVATADAGRTWTTLPA